MATAISYQMVIALVSPNKNAPSKNFSLQHHWRSSSQISPRATGPPSRSSISTNSSRGVRFRHCERNKAMSGAYLGIKILHDKDSAYRQRHDFVRHRPRHSGSDVAHAPLRRSARTRRGSAHVVRADFFFTPPAVVVQPVTGAALIAPTGADPLAHGWWPPTRSMRSPACAGCRSFGCKSESAGSHTMP